MDQTQEFLLYRVHLLVLLQGEPLDQQRLNQRDYLSKNELNDHFAANQCRLALHNLTWPHCQEWHIPLLR